MTKAWLSNLWRHPIAGGFISWNSENQMDDLGVATILGHLHIRSWLYDGLVLLGNLQEAHILDGTNPP
jgi:hypothetical protein